MKIDHIIIGCDHGGYELKLQVIDYLQKKGIRITDVGCDSADSCDYPIYASALCKHIQMGDAPLGILICGTGIGMSLVANKHKGIRAAVCSDTFSARLTREHNNANVLCFGARVVGIGLALELVDAFLGADFEGGKHKRRVDMIDEIERKGGFES